MPSSGTNNTIVIEPSGTGTSAKNLELSRDSWSLCHVLVDKGRHATLLDTGIIYWHSSLIQCSMSTLGMDNNAKECKGITMQ